jgi:light-regulated signal transduction histidine kinase (bacteriophytochrome)
LPDSVVADLKRAEPQRRVEVVIPPGLQAQADAKLLRIALVNLLSNAWKFTGRQSAARIELGAQDGDDGRAYYVRDNGAGFDMAYADKLFGVFQRLHTPAEFPGTGVGLAIVQRIVQRHGGRIWADSAPDRGATFYFTLPGSTARPAEA